MKQDVCDYACEASKNMAYGPKQGLTGLVLH